MTDVNEALAAAATKGNQGAQVARGVDIGALEEAPVEEALIVTEDEQVPAEAAAETETQSDA